MPITVEIEGKGEVAQFPDGTDQKVIDATIKRDYFGSSSGGPEKHVPVPSVSERLWTGAGRNIAGLIKTMVNPVEAGMNVGQALGTPEGRKALAEPIVKSIEDPSGIPGRLYEYTIDNPVNMALNVSLGAGAIGKASELAGMTRTAEALSTAAKATEPFGAASEITKQTIGRTGLPESLYARSMKIPPGSLREEGRAKVLNALIREEGLPLGRRKKMTKIIGELDDRIGMRLDQLSQGGAELDINILMKGLDSLKSQYTNRPNAQKYIDAIDSVKDTFINHDFVDFATGKISLADAHSLKKGAWQEVISYFAKKDKPETGRIGISSDVEAAATAKAASILREGIITHPDVPASVVKDLNREAGLMYSRKWVERAANRGGNLDPVGLASMAFGILIDHGISPTIAYRVATSQPIMSRFAIGLARGFPKTTKIGNMVVKGAYATEQIGTGE